MRGWGVLASGVVFCGLTSFLGDTSLMMGAVTQSWVPYVAVPFAMGFVAVPTTVVRAGLLGSLSSLILVVAFYAVRPFDTGGHPVDTTSILYEYGPIGLVTGFMLAALARSMATRAAAAPGRFALACCSFVTLALLASWAFLGWGAHEVVTSSGIVAVGASTADVVASSALVLAFSCAVIVFAIFGLPGLIGRQSTPEQPSPTRDHPRGESTRLP